MTSDNINAKPDSLSSIFEWMPCCALIVDTNGIIQEVNQNAVRFFRAETKEDFIFDKQNIVNMIIDSHRGNELIKFISKSTETVNKEILLRRFDKTITGVEIHACTIPGNTRHILIQFYEKKPQNQIYIYELSQAFRREALRLKPYLNKPGKNILDELIINDMVDGILSTKTSTKTRTIIIGEDRIQRLTQQFPEFSANELTFCGYLSLKMSIEEIAGLTGNTPNSLRVSFHRILKKTNFQTGKEFLRVLEKI